MTKSISIIVSNYPPETNAAAKRAHALAQAFVDNDWETQVITQAPHYPQGRIYEGYASRKTQIRYENSIKVIRLIPKIVPKNNLIKRLIAELIYIMKALKQYCKNKSDMVYVSSPYMFNGFFAMILTKALRKKIIWEVRDLTWFYGEAVGKDKLRLGRALEWIMLFTASKVDCIVTTTQGQADYFKERTDVKNLIVCPNGVSRRHLEIIHNAKPLPKNRFTVVYCGLIGYPQGLITLIMAAEMLPEINFIIVGDGVEKQSLERVVNDKNLNNVHFKGYVPFEEVARYYKTADVLYTQLRDSPVFNKTQPSKIWEYMAACKPIIYGGKGEAAEVIQNTGAGLVVPPEDHYSLVDVILRLQTDTSKLQHMGELGRQYVLKNRKREELCQQLVSQLKCCLE